MQTNALRFYVAAAALMASSAAFAQTGAPDLSWTHAGVQYTNQSLDDWDCDQDGINIYGNLEVSEDWYVSGAYTDVSGDPCGSSSFTVGGGYHQPFNDTFDWYGAVAFQTVSPDYGSSDSGIRLGGGLRGFLKPRLESRVELFHVTVGDGATGIAGGLAYFFQPDIAGTLDLSLTSDSTAFAIGARLNF